MKSIGNRGKVALTAALILAVVVVLAGTVLPLDNPVKRFFKQQEALSTAKMHMSQVKSGKVYTGALRFADDIDFDNLALSQAIPTYSVRQDGEVVRGGTDVYAVYSDGEVVALFGIHETEVPGTVTGGTTMSNIGLEVVQDMLNNPGTCACVSSYGYSGELYVAPNSKEAVVVFGPGLSFPDEPPAPLPAPEVVPLESVGITSTMISQIDFPEHRDPIPFSV